MLFDLRGRGRRRTVQVIYLGLAILMGGGLVLFGIGSSSSGGLFDALSGNAGTSATSAIDKRVERQLAVTRRRPQDAKAWSALAQARYQRAGIDGIAADQQTYNAKGKAQLRLAAQAWERHLALNPKQPDVRTAKFMVQAYGKAGINELPKAVRALEIVTDAEKPPSTNLYQQLAQLAYTAGETRSGDLAAARAIELAPAKDRKPLREALNALKKQSTTQQVQPQPSATG
ncbi:MAG: hypothetical protein QOK16_4757 [Solirubrobacteraceae bacterium]|jgi:hypothetical protein|nr:hypothetical protein [Solirubrobacteraceae bacterium]MEA2189746.1 hypothetical protein [Solirubrobacteraceae bacterium]